MTTVKDIENIASLARITCGWKKPELPLDWVRRYWRDVHSPAISRRVGIYDYRHYQYDAVDSGLFKPVPGVDLQCPADQQLMWNSDVRYRDDAGLAAFDSSPPPDVKPHMLGDIELIVHKSTTYRAVGENAFTYVDQTNDPTPQGAPDLPSYSIFLRQNSDETGFRAFVRSLAERWSRLAGVHRVRISLFDVPDMEAERKAGYPIKTHPLPQQYQAVVDLVIAHRDVASELIGEHDTDLPEHVSTLHAYPVAARYTSVYGGRPTIVGLRGYAAHQAIEALGADNQKQVSLLEWMYGPIAEHGPVQVKQQ